MKKITAILLTCGIILGITACGNQTAENNQRSSTDSQTEATNEGSGQDNADNQQEENTNSSTETAGENALVAYFAYSENIGDTSDMSADAITSASGGTTDNTEGNLQVMAQVIQEDKNADVFHIVAEEPYDPGYDVMHDRAMEEIDNGTLPALTDTVDNLEQYDVVYLGMPVWSGSLPQPVVTFLTENDLSGKTIVPFGINLGSRFGNMLNQIEEICPDTSLADGFTVNARNGNDEVREEFSQWLADLEL